MADVASTSSVQMLSEQPGEHAVTGEMILAFLQRRSARLDRRLRILELDLLQHGDAMVQRGARTPG